MSKAASVEFVKYQGLGNDFILVRKPIPCLWPATFSECRLVMRSFSNHKASHLPECTQKGLPIQTTTDGGEFSLPGEVIAQVMHAVTG